MEEWVKIAGLPDGFEVSSWGQIRISNTDAIQIEIGWSNKDGYCVIKLCDVLFYVHELVLNNFTEKPDWAQCINHKNGLKWDCRLSNLEWSTHKLNRQHAIQTGLAKDIKWRKVKKCPVTPTT